MRGHTPKACNDELVKINTQEERRVAKSRKSLAVASRLYYITLGARDELRQDFTDGLVRMPAALRSWRCESGVLATARICSMRCLAGNWLGK